MHNPRAAIATRESEDGSGTWFASLRGRPELSVKARYSGLLNPLLAKSEPTPPGVNFSIVLSPLFTA
jgi:hypothetical protein